MSTEVFSSTNFDAVWGSASDVWVLLNPDTNQWTEKIDWSLGQLLRRSLVRFEESKQPSDVLLLASPEGVPSPCVLVIRNAKIEGSEWLRALAPVLTKLKAKTATIFPPQEWRPPTLKTIAECSKGEWGLRWVEPTGS